ncbi:orotate phosphoribosyltransferase [Paenibacillus sp. 1_12]|uniref:orotate phosphoribosyltransferase n=1 Tax=Paenibacillus sp. 1_12 TaxID=1566278 RepID=UPI0008F1FEB6|nr:orotate phosphoribosyltransferase [Paenibacillus sp. 1_12]SFL68476.1 orotate phosphoribosyltransferase [Paenibacillus sp. 1_12]
MDYHQLAASLYKTAYLSGDFKLRSGQRSNQYFDKYRFEADPVLLAEIARKLKKLVPEDTGILAGLEMGGIPIATALSLETGIPAAFVRKKAKEYGTSKLAEGADITNKKVCIIEDVVTTGGQIISSAQELKALGAHIEFVLCVIERDPISKANLEQDGLTLVSLFTMDDLLLAGKGS